MGVVRSQQNDVEQTRPISIKGIFRWRCKKKGIKKKLTPRLEKKARQKAHYRNSNLPTRDGERGEIEKFASPRRKRWGFRRSEEATPLKRSCTS